MEYSITNLAVDNVGENVYVKVFAEGVEMEQRENPLLVSVLFASYNHEKYVEAAIRSIMAQEGVKFELIVIDDGSTDSSPQILEKLQKEFDFQYIHRPNKGLVATMNELLAMARGKYFCSFASDDIMPPKRLLLQSTFLALHPLAAACFGQVVPMDENGNVRTEKDARYLRSVPQVSFEESFLGKKALHGCSEMFVREKILSVGGYDERYYFEDYPLFLKVLHCYGPQPVSADIVCCYYREHDVNMHRNTTKIYEEILRVLSDNYSNHALYRKAVNCWKANWFSTLTMQDKKEALRRLPQLASLSFPFLKRLPKIFIPKRFLPY